MKLTIFTNSQNKSYAESVKDYLSNYFGKVCISSYYTAGVRHYKVNASIKYYEYKEFKTIINNAKNFVDENVNCDISQFTYGGSCSISWDRDSMRNDEYVLYLAYLNNIDYVALIPQMIYHKIMAETVDENYYNFQTYIKGLYHDIIDSLQTKLVIPILGKNYYNDSYDVYSANEKMIDDLKNAYDERVEEAKHQANKFNCMCYICALISIIAIGAIVFDIIKFFS